MGRDNSYESPKGSPIKNEKYQKMRRGNLLTNEYHNVWKYIYFFGFVNDLKGYYEWLTILSSLFVCTNILRMYDFFNYKYVTSEINITLTKV